MAVPTKEQLELWWNSLQEALDTAGTKIDLSKRADRCLFTMISYDEAPKGSLIGEILNPKEKLAFIDNAHYEDKTFNHLSATPDSIFSKLETGTPSEEMLRTMYDKASSGLLFIRCKYGYQDALNRQILVDDDGKAVVANDIDHVDKKHDAIIQDMMVANPLRPQKPGLGTRILAFFGHRASRDKVDDYNRKMTRYNQKLEEYNAAQERFNNADPKVKTEAVNLIRVSSCYFNNIGIEDIDYIMTYQGKISSMYHYDELHKKIETAMQEAATVMNAPHDDEKTKESFAKLVCLNLIDNKYHQMADEGNFYTNEDTLAVLNKFDGNHKSLNKLTNELLNNKTFNDLYDELSPEDVNTAIADNCKNFTKDLVKEEAISIDNIENPDIVNEIEEIITTEVPKAEVNEPQAKI